MVMMRLMLWILIRNVFFSSISLRDLKSGLDDFDTMGIRADD